MRLAGEKLRLRFARGRSRTITMSAIGCGFEQRNDLTDFKNLRWLCAGQKSNPNNNLALADGASGSSFE